MSTITPGSSGCFETDSVAQAHFVLAAILLLQSPHWSFICAGQVMMGLLLTFCYGPEDSIRPLRGRRYHLLVTGVGRR